MHIAQQIKTYFELADEIHKYFDYKENWVCIPMDNRIGDYWMVIGEGVDGRYVYSPKPFSEKLIEVGKEIYSGFIYTQRFLKKWVYRGEEMTMICTNTQTDGNKFLMLFENDKECVDEFLKKKYMEKWGKLVV